MKKNVRWSITLEKKTFEHNKSKRNRWNTLDRHRSNLDLEQGKVLKLGISLQFFCLKIFE